MVVGCFFAGSNEGLKKVHKSCLTVKLNLNSISPARIIISELYMKNNHWNFNALFPIYLILLINMNTYLLSNSYQELQSWLKLRVLEKL